MSSPDRRIFTIPNLMTLMRLLILIPIFYCLAHEQRLWVLFWGALGILTDLSDGWVARRLHQTSDLGRMMDPVVDKINVIAVTFYMTLSPFYDFPLWYFIFLIIREMMVMMGGLIISRKQKIIFESNTPGKRSAFFTGVMVVLFILDWQPYAWILLWISLALTLISTGQYVRIFRDQMRIKTKEQRPKKQELRNKN